MPFLPQEISDHPSLIGIIRMPSCSVKSSSMFIPFIQEDIEGNFESMRLNVQMASTITSSSVTGTPINISKSSVTDFYPYTYYVLTDGECEPLIMYPQYMPSSAITKGKFALSNQPIERYYVHGYKGDTTGNVYNITNLNQMMLPTATNEGMNYLNANANTIMQNRKSTQVGNVLSMTMGVGGVVGGALTGNPLAIAGGVGSLVGGVISGNEQIKQIDARNKDAMLTPTSISSFGNPSSRLAFDTDKVHLLKYSIKDNVKNKINSYIQRYGNKYNNYATINLKSYKGYVKFISPDIDSSIDNIYLNKINSILEKGVYCE